MDYKKIWSYAANIIVFTATLAMIFLVLSLDTSGRGITRSEFTPIRNCMFAIGIPCFIKFYISSNKEYRESKKWLIGYFLCSIAWIAFLIYVYIFPYFTNIRTMCLSSFVLMGIGAYLEYSIAEK